MRIRGVLEGFYGQPWSHAERLDLLEFCGREGFNTWVHAPKDDPYHRERWRDPYPSDELERFAELQAAAERHGIDFVYAIAPGLSVCYSQESELEALVAKCEQLREAGVGSFHLLFDDVEQELNCAEDEAVYGHEPRPSAAAQADLSNRFRRALPQDDPLVVCPRGYAGTETTDYREVFGRRLDREVVVYWTGLEVVSTSIVRADLDAAASGFGHELLLWDNYPVNDFAPEQLFLGPLRGRDAALAGGRCAGLVANAMLQAIPSKLPLATVADFLRDPQGYDPARSFDRALREYGEEVSEAVRSLGSTIEIDAALAALGGENQPR
jgi:hyaluronoglucosaminidase